jgi:membrane-bound metal-dependent hydrolase YbcI (DUF457 family)
VLRKCRRFRLDSEGSRVEMTIFEHAMVGIDGALALGLQRRHGWQIVALAGLAAALPDIDGLTILFGIQCYAEGHRLWGHNLLVAGLAAVIVSAAAYWSDVATRVQQWLAKRCNAFSTQGDCDAGVSPACAAGRAAPHDGKELALWVAVGIVAAYSHLLLDVAFSAGNGQPIWGVPLLWPFSSTAHAFPLFPWGDIGATVILAAAMFAMLRWPARVQAIAAGSLFAVAAYMAVRGFFG